jgi:hypothetical protein
MRHLQARETIHNALHQKPLILLNQRSHGEGAISLAAACLCADWIAQIEAARHKLGSVVLLCGASCNLRVAAFMNTGIDAGSDGDKKQK